MRLRRAAASALSAVALSGGLMLAVGGTAWADPAPACMYTHVTHPGGAYIKVNIENRCGHAVRAKIIWGRANDGGCRDYQPGGTYMDWRGSFARFDGLENC